VNGQVSIYSSFFAANASVASGHTVLFTFPNTGVCVIRDIVLTAKDTGTTSAAIDVEGVIIFSAIGNTVQYASWHWEGRQVPDTFDTLGISVFSGHWDVRVSGYLLTA
jgi:hypothetical protein